jgi:hypothetical protein
MSDRSSALSEQVVDEMDAKVAEAKERGGPLDITFGDIYAWIRMLNEGCS